jgi:hypothetical protein
VDVGTVMAGPAPMAGTRPGDDSKERAEHAAIDDMTGDPVEGGWTDGEAAGPSAEADRPAPTAPIESLRLHG